LKGVLKISCILAILRVRIKFFSASVVRFWWNTRLDSRNEMDTNLEAATTCGDLFTIHVND
jgi:hypothetical protein